MRWMFLIAAVFCCNGCGTVLSTYFHGLNPYGGVKLDVENISEATTDKHRWITDDTPPVLDRFEALQALSLVVVACDVPFSLVADTCLLPLWLMGFRHVLEWM